MKLTSFARVFCAIALFSAGPLAAEEPMMVHDAYVRSSTAGSLSGAAFMMVMNHSGIDDRLIGASSDVAERVEFHQHTEDANGVMRMGEIEGGVPIAADGVHIFQRGGDHLMFLGLKQPLLQDDVIKVTLEFEKAGPVEIEVIVDHNRQPNDTGMKHDATTHGTMDHSSHGKMSN